ncbi:VOC family protein [Breoghania sp. L-A4]|uniref:VOC family protein n=1 Tax=Breoghania sp. L-A4 TaxID=2304600 RepID=UPI000E35B92A|nr:VOC family protein [Breoghania sp. L-A4]AXS39903.1 VOC family protein [Breoghania sp. L-A4]
MEQRLSLITLGVDDLGAARRFFEHGLGWTRANVDSDAVAFYQCGSTAFGLFGRADLAKDAGLPDDAAAPGHFVPCSIAWNARSEAEVDAAFAETIAAGATPVKRPEKVFWGGYSGYVRIPGCDHLLEIAYNPGFPMGEDGSVVLP